MSRTVITWMKNNTLTYCDNHGYVSGKFGKASPQGMCKNSKYYISYCCGLRCTDKEPVSIYDLYHSSEESVTE